MSLRKFFKHYVFFLLTFLTVKLILVSCQRELEFPPTQNNVATIAGNGIAGFADGKGSIAQFSLPEGIAIDGLGNIYIADFGNHRIRKLSLDGEVTTLAGNGTRGHTDGPGKNAQFNYPQAVAADAVGNVYVADYGNNVIRRITSGGIVSTFAGNGRAGFIDGAANLAQFNQPRGVAVDNNGTVFVVEGANNCVRMISSAGVVSTLAGTGTAGYIEGDGKIAQFKHPRGVTIDDAGNVYVADSENQRIRKITPGRIVSTLAGNGVAGFADGMGISAQFNFPRGVTTDNKGNIYVADTENHRIRKISANGMVSTLGGNGIAGFADGNDSLTLFNFPRGIAFFNGNLYVADQENHRIRKLSLP